MPRSGHRRRTRAGAAQCAHARRRGSSGRVRSPVRSCCCRCWSCCPRRHRGRAGRPRRPQRHARRRAGEAIAVAGRWPTPPSCARPGHRRPDRAAAALRRGGARRHRHGLRRRHGPRPHPLHPPRPRADRPAVHRRPRGAPEGEVFTQEYVGTLGARSARSCPSWTTAGSSRWSRSASRSTGSTASSRDLPAIRSRRRRPARGLLGAWLIAGGCAGRRTAWASARSPGCTSTTGPSWPPCAKGCCSSTTSSAVQLVNDEARRLLALPDDVEGRSLGDLGLPPGLVAAARAARAEPDQIYVLGEQVLRPQLGSRLLGGPARSARSSRSATARSCRP